METSITIFLVFLMVIVLLSNILDTSCCFCQSKYGLARGSGECLNISLLKYIFEYEFFSKSFLLRVVGQKILNNPCELLDTSFLLFMLVLFKMVEVF